MRPIPSSRLKLLIAVTVIAALTACSGPRRRTRMTSNPPRPATYYLALGDSLAQGVQPNASGVSVMTRDGYPNQVYAVLHASRPGLKLVKLGCPGETTTSMINGGICRYRGGSQLAAAVAFLQAHRGRVLLVTLDIGANDPEHCGGQPGLGQLAKCAVKDIPAAVDNLGTIMQAEGGRRAGRPHRRDELLPARAGRMAQRPAGRLVAWTAEKLAATYNAMLGRVYAKSGAGSRTCSARSRPPTSPGQREQASRATSPGCASGPGSAPPRPAGPTSTPTRPVTRSSPGRSCKHPA